jgi:hypothetical protein
VPSTPAILRFRSRPPCHDAANLHTAHLIAARLLLGAPV